MPTKVLEARDGNSSSEGGRILVSMSDAAHAPANVGTTTAPEATYDASSKDAFSPAISFFVCVCVSFSFFVFAGGGRMERGEKENVPVR